MTFRRRHSGQSLSACRGTWFHRSSALPGTKDDRFRPSKPARRRRPSRTRHSGPDPSACPGTRRRTRPATLHTRLRTCPTCTPVRRGTRSRTFHSSQDRSVGRGSFPRNRSVPCRTTGCSAQRRTLSQRHMPCRTHRSARGRRAVIRKDRHRQPVRPGTRARTPPPGRCFRHRTHCRMRRSWHGRSGHPRSSARQRFRTRGAMSRRSCRTPLRCRPGRQGTRSRMRHSWPDPSGARHIARRTRPARSDTRPRNGLRRRASPQGTWCRTCRSVSCPSGGRRIHCRRACAAAHRSVPRRCSACPLPRGHRRACRRRRFHRGATARSKRAASPRL